MLVVLLVTYRAAVLAPGLLGGHPALLGCALALGAWIALRRLPRWRRKPVLESDPALTLFAQYRRALAASRGENERAAVRRLFALAASVEAALRTAPEHLGDLFREARRRSFALARKGIAALEVAQQQADRLGMAERMRIPAGSCDEPEVDALRASAARAIADLRARHEAALREVACVTAALERVVADVLSSAAPIATAARAETRRLLEESELASRAARALRELPAEGEEKPLPPPAIPVRRAGRPVTRRICPGPFLAPLGLAGCGLAFLAAVATPNVMVFHCKSKQSEAKTNLSGLFTAEKAFYGQYGYYTTDLTQLNWTPDGSPLYLYGFVADGPARDGNHPERRTTIHADVVAFGGYHTDRMKDLSGASLHPGDLARVADATVGPQGFKAVAVGDIDPDTDPMLQLDVWTIDQDRRLVPVENDCTL